MAELKRGGDRCATIDKVSLNFWNSASTAYKLRFEELVKHEGKRYEREYALFLDWKKKHDDERDGIVN